MLDDNRCRFLNLELIALLGAWRERLKGRMGFDLITLTKQQNTELGDLVWKHRREFGLSKASGDPHR